MACTMTHFAPRARSRIDAFFNRFGQDMNAQVKERSRQARIKALDAKSDTELARIGVTRDRIVAPVFRDIL